jgi:WD40 repeat protein
VLDEFDGQHSSTVRELAISPDGRTLASITTDDATVRLWNVADGSLQAVLTGHAAPLNEVAFSPDGRRLATGGTDTDVGVWWLDPEDAVRQLCDNLADVGEEPTGC